MLEENNSKIALHWICQVWSGRRRFHIRIAHFPTCLELSFYSSVCFVILFSSFDYFLEVPSHRLALELSGPILRDTARLSQRYPPSQRAVGFLVSQHANWVRCPLPLFWAFPPLESMRSGGARPPPTTKGGSQLYLRDALWKQGKSVRYPSLRYYLERVLRDIGGASRTGPLRGS